MFRDGHAAGASEARAAGGEPTTLDRLQTAKGARVVRLALAEAELDWVRAVGIFEGEQLCVLRRAAFGGPLHVRTGSGGEFALDRRLAATILVQAA